MEFPERVHQVASITRSSQRFVPSGVRDTATTTPRSLELASEPAEFPSCVPISLRHLLCHGRRVCLGYEPHRDQAFSTAIDEPRAQERSSTNTEAAPPEYLVGVILVVNSLLAELHRRGHLQIVKLESSNGDLCPFCTSGP